MKYGSVCSGIEAATVAWKPLGWEAQFFSEIEAFPSKVLKHHYPAVPNLGDMTKLENNKIFIDAEIDALVGGTPCQSFSLAGLRKGLDSENGSLALHFCRLLIAKQPRWFVWENVPGVFSSFTDEKNDEAEQGDEVTQTSDFATILQAFQECGYSCAWRVLDSKYWGVAQRRRRVFVVGHLGDDWRAPAAVLFESESLRGDITESRKEGEKTAGNTGKGANSGNGGGLTWPPEIAATLTKSYGKKQGLENQHIFSGAGLYVAAYSLQNTAFTRTNGRGNGLGISEEISFTLLSKEIPGVAYATDLTQRPDKITMSTNIAPALTAGTHAGHGCSVVYLKDVTFLAVNARESSLATAENVSLSLTKNRMPGAAYSRGVTIHGTDKTVNTASFSETAQCLRTRPPGQVENSSTTVVLDENELIVRRLTPLECERLQGFPDNYTNIPGAKDTPRYEAIGNSMTTNVMHWIGQRIQAVDETLYLL